MLCALCPKAVSQSDRQLCWLTAAGMGSHDQLACSRLVGFNASLAFNGVLMGSSYELLQCATLGEKKYIVIFPFLWIRELNQNFKG